MITYLAKEGYAEATCARSARQLAFSRYLHASVPGSVTHFTSADRGRGSLRGAAGTVARLFAGVRLAWSSENPWVVVDYPNHPASVPRRLPVFLCACAYLAALRVACTLRGVGIVVQSDDDPAIQDEWLSDRRLGRLQLLWERLYETMLFHAADRLWFSGESAAKMLCAKFRVPLSRATHVPNGGPAPSRTPVALPAGTFRFVYAGALRRDGQHLVPELIDAFARVSSESARLVLLGSDGEWIPAYLESRPDPRVLYLGRMPMEEAQAVVLQCDAGVLTGVPGGYYSTGFPGKLGAYLAAGLPLVATCGGDVARLIAERGVGVACEPDRLADAMERLTLDADAYDGLRGRAAALGRVYAWDSIFDRAIASLPAAERGRGASSGEHVIASAGCSDRRRGR